MMLERQEIACKLTPTMIRLRKAFFFMRNLQRIEYKSLDGKMKTQMLVSPLSFLIQVHTKTLLKVYDHTGAQDLKNKVLAEFKNCQPLDKNMQQALDLAKENNPESKIIQFKEGNVLNLTIKEIDLQKFGVIINGETKYQSLEFVVSLSYVSKPAT